MPLELELTFLTEEQCKEFATRQVLTFLRLPPPADAGEAIAPSKRGFLVSAIPERSHDERDFAWSITNLFDVDERLLFRDAVLALDQGREIRIRTAASDLL